MFLDFYQLKEQPFGVTPDPHFLYLGASHREALASLCYGVKTGRGLLALVAPPGMGKTTLLFRFLEHLRHSARTAFLFQTQCDSNGLLHYLLGDLGINTRGQSFVDMHDQLNSLLLEEARAGRRFVLVIDEAQNLGDAVLETARLLSDFETPNEKLLQIVLAGQPQLAEKLKRPELVQLRQRISILGRLEPFSPAEVNNYIDHRLGVAGCAAVPLFTPAAVEKVAAYSQGIPRNINNLCFNALSLGFALRRKQIDEDLVDEAAADLELSSLTGDRRPDQLPVAPSSLARTTVAADGTMMSAGGDSSAALTNVQPPAWTRELPTPNHNAAAAMQPFDDPRNEAVEGRDDDKGVLILEFLEHAVARNADILAEIADDCVEAQEGRVGTVGASGAPTQIRIAIERVGLPNPFENGAEQLPVDSIESTVGNRVPDAGPPEPSGRSAMSYGAKSKHPVERFVAAAAVFVLALLAGISYRQEIKTAAAQTRRTLAAAALDLTSSGRANNAQPRGPVAQSPDMFAEGKRELTDPVAAVSGATPVVIPQADSTFTPQVRQMVTSIAVPASPRTPPQVQFASETTTVIVRPRDNLRLICLRYLGRYDARAVRDIRGLNPELTDPSHVTVGQHILLPGSVTVQKAFESARR